MSPTAETITHQYPHPPTRIGSAKPGGRRPSTGRRRLSRNDSVKDHFRMKYNMSSGHVQNSSVTDIDHKLKLEFFQKEPCKYSHEVFLKAAKIYSALKHDSRDERENPYLQRKNRDALAAKVQDIPHLVFTDDQEKRLVFELAFTALKYQMLFEDVLQDCSFFAQFPEFNEDSGLVMVMLCDFQSRKFQQRTPFTNETLDETAEQVEEALLQVKTRLNAALARHRIKAAAPSLDHLLPDAVRSKEELRSNMPMYVWVNQIKTTISEVIEQFKDDGYKLVDSGEKLEERQFSVDNLCNDVLMFPPESKEDLIECELLQSGKIVLQDKSSCLAPHSVKYLLGEGDDIIHVNAGSGATTAHIASLLQDNNNHIWTFGSQSTTDVQKIQKTMERLGIKGVKNLQDSFLDIEPDDPRFKNVKVILVTADCSKSGITNPIDFIVNEGEDAKILKDLSVGETDLTKLGELVGQHGNLLKHAMKCKYLVESSSSSSSSSLPSSLP
ncbi:hypothetical protein KUTeg_024725 [Tegillarca granosa]|uniref:SAM-dependent MTase RsmB/NOP-type domain-containing protein n=1 Tax=Tegillarca granosa TaxID=220873 RepID=A0ABQ9DYQ1_TEGGR|nr:hypothetical protein KUTeg_024725 [Tegillarca granosa]